MADKPIFTFHNVSINTTQAPEEKVVNLALHSTMFLLILEKDAYHHSNGTLYIPQCFY